MLKRVERRPHHIVRIGSANRFGHNILNPQRLKNGAHWTTCDNTGAGRRRTQEHFARTVVAMDIVMKGTTFTQGDANQIPLRRIRRFLDRVRYLPCLPMAKADAPLLIAHDDKSGEPKPPATFYHLGDTIDMNELVYELAIAIIALPFPTSAMWFSRHQRTLSFVSSPSLSRP